VLVSDELLRRMIKPRNLEVETRKENVSWKPIRRIKPTSDLLIEKYVMR
jgi:hypothetical protein